MFELNLISLLKFLLGERGDHPLPLDSSDFDRLENLRRRNDSRIYGSNSPKRNLITRARYKQIERVSDQEGRAKLHWLDCDPAYSEEGMVQGLDASQLFRKTVGKRTPRWVEFSKILLSKRGA